MRAVTVPEFGGADALVVADVPEPEPATGEVLLRVASAGVNRGDILQRLGFYPPPPGASEILGLECAGEIVAVGEGVDPGRIGEMGVALVSGGAQAEFAAVPSGQVAALPDGIDIVTAGGVMEAAATVWANIVTTGHLASGETILIHGGAGGIGTFAIQVAKALGARVVTTVGSAEKAELCTDLGADLVVNYQEQDFVEAMATADLQADVVLDIMGAKYLNANVSVLATGGRVVVIGMQGGVQGELNLAALLTRRASIAATTIRSRSIAEKSAIVADVVEHVWPMLTAGTVRPIIHAALPLADVAEAHRLVEGYAHTGKVVLTL